MLSPPPSPLDRDAERRADPGVLESLLDDARTRVVITVGDDLVVDPTPEGPTVRLVEPAAVLRHPGDGRGPFPESPGTVTAYLGRLEGVSLVLVAHPAADDRAGLADHEVAGLRDVLPAGTAVTSAIAVTAVGLAAWHRRHGFCSTCGSPTVITDAGWVRRCPGCGAHHFPRTDPAVIMAVTDDDDRLLLGRQGRWPAGRFSVLAGFVEPGESVEDAVRRETLEEAGVHVDGIEYRGSEPWPMPRSLMLGFRAHALPGDITVDGTELAEAAWWGRAELAEAVAAGRLTLPGRMSVARRLIEEWFGGALDEPPRTSF